MTLSTRYTRVNELAVDELAALDAGHGCGLCLDDGHLPGLGPCEACRPDAFVEYLLDHANGQVAATRAEEHDQDHFDESALHDVYGEVA